MRICQTALDVVGHHEHGPDVFGNLGETSRCSPFRLSSSSALRNKIRVPARFSKARVGHEVLAVQHLANETDRKNRLIPLEQPAIILMVPGGGDCRRGGVPHEWGLGES